MVNGSGTRWYCMRVLKPFGQGSLRFNAYCSRYGTRFNRLRSKSQGSQSSPDRSSRSNNERADTSTFDGAILTVRSPQSIARGFRQASSREKHVADLSRHGKSILRRVHHQEKYAATRSVNHGRSSDGLGKNETGRIVAFGTGSRCSALDNIDEDGGALLDCHGLAMARRALLQSVSSFDRQTTGSVRQVFLW